MTTKSGVYYAAGFLVHNCGAPVLVTDFSAMPELVRWGHKINVADMYLTPMHSYQAWPSKADMTDKLNRLYEAWLLCGGEWPLAKRIETQNAIHAEYSWDAIVRDQWAPLMTRLAEDAPPLDGRFQVAVPGMPSDTQGFVDAINEGVQQEQQPVPQRRVAPLVKRIVSDLETIQDGVQPIVLDVSPEPELTFEKAHAISKRRRKSAPEVAQMMAANGAGEAVTP